MGDKIIEVSQEYQERASQIESVEQLEQAKVEFLGKKGKITELLQGLRTVTSDLRREMGAKINELKQKVEQDFANKLADIKAKELQREIENSEVYDITMPTNKKSGSLHPITIVQKQVEEVFKSMGFIVEDGNEIETEYNNFEAVNVPKNHPARDMQDTFWLSNGEVLKTQTSAGQNRILRTYGAPCKVIFPGRCFRNENVDASHENTFFQLEGIMVGENISIANLIYFMKEMLSKVFKKDINVRLRPGYFPFTEPSFELDASCPFCGGKAVLPAKMVAGLNFALAV